MTYSSVKIPINDNNKNNKVDVSIIYVFLFSLGRYVLYSAQKPFFFA